MHLLIGVGQGTQPDSVCAVGQCIHPAENQSIPHLPSDVLLGQLQLVYERIGLENGIVLPFSN